MMITHRLRVYLILPVALVWSALAFAGGPVYRVLDMLRDIHQNHEGLAKLTYFFETVAAKSIALTFTPAASEAYDFADQVIQSVTFDKVFSSPIALILPDKARVFSLVGETHGKSFIVDYRKATIEAVNPAELLDFAAELRVSDDVKPLPDEKRGFGLTLGFKADLGELSHRSLMRGGAGFLRVLSPENLRLGSKVPTEAPTEAATQDSTEKSKADLDARIMTEFKVTMPETEMLVRNYAKISPNIKVVRGADGLDYTLIDTAVVIHLDKLTRDYPEMGEFLERLMTSLDLNVAVRYELQNGLNLARFEVVTPRQSFRINYLTRRGLVIPTDNSGRPHLEAAVDLDTLKIHEGRIFVDAAAEVLGLKITAKDVVTSVKFEDGVIARQKIKLQSMPTPKVEGRALWIFPTWAIDLSIPGSLDELLSRFTQGFLQGHGGSGTYSEFIVNTKDPKATKVASISSTEFIDNFFINFGMRVAQSYIWPKKLVLADAWKLSQNFAKAIAHDLAKLNQIESTVAH